MRKFAVALKDITVFTAVTGAQVMSAVYNAKWKGSTSYKRLLKIKGEENGLIFVNIGLEADSPENKKLLKGIKKEFEEHGILFAELPDLCGGDGNTQICVSARDAQKLSAMLLSHMNGELRDVPVAEISQFDYTATAFRADGRPTPEFDQILNSADPNQVPFKEMGENLSEQRKRPMRERVAKTSTKAQKVTKTLPAADKAKIIQSFRAERQTETGRGADALSPDLIPDFLHRSGEHSTKVFSFEAETGQQKEPIRRRRKTRRRNPIQNLGRTISDKVIDFTDSVKRSGSRKRVPAGYADGMPDPCPNLSKKVVAQIIREHEFNVIGGRDSYLWLDERPVVSADIKGEKYHLVSLPEGDKGIIIPDSSYREYDFDNKTGYFFGKRGAFVCEAKDYYTVDYKTGDISVLPGDDVIKAAKKSPVESYAEKLEQMMLDAKQKALLGDKVKSAVSRRM